MSVARRTKREKAPAVELFNEMLFKIISHEGINSEIVEDQLFVDDSTTELFLKCNQIWRNLCMKARANNKKIVSFKIDALEKSFDDHLKRREQSVWADHLVKILFEKYGYQLTIQKANEYYSEDRLALEVAESIIIKLYHMHLIEIPEIGYKVEIPSEMPEMTGEQFVYFAGLLVELQAKAISIDDLRIRMVMKMLDVESSEEAYEKLSGQAKDLISENVTKVADMVDFFFTMEEGKLSMNLGFTKNFIRTIKGFGLLKLHGPADALTDINFLEYKDASNYYRAFNESKDEQDLNRMIAVLYRYKFLKWKLPYRPEGIEARAKQIGKLPYPVRFAIYLFVMACEDFLKNGSINIDGSDIKLHLLYEETVKEKQKSLKQKYSNNTGLAGVALSLAGTGIFGAIDQVYKQNLYDVLLLMYKQRIEYLNQLENL